MTFTLVSSAIWPFSHKIAKTRREELYAFEFGQIVGMLVSGAQRSMVRGEFNNDPSGGYLRHSLVRYRVRLLTDAKAVDLFHNGAGGYRAQYYSDPSIGELANQYVCRHLSELVISWGCSSAARSSLSAGSAKAWIAQGRWIRPPRKNLQNLFVERWMCDPRTADAHRRKLWKFSQLTPGEEDRVDLIGGWLRRSDFSSLSVDYKSGRSAQIHFRGFT